MDLRARTSEVDQRMRAALEPMTTIGSLHGQLGELIAADGEREAASD